ncbi:hypothetical protein Pint_28944 [Pistacia integerrima]|uniref:Uncharacterized protein n=1 Tax=Pistacia integerrima TaxID=434235 RepID=A0ACC0X303_9ROSI|nr:hypothetical protein Pint_28944 [Pistacia integerrima]
MADTATESTKGKTKFSAMSGMRRRSSKTTAFLSVFLFLVLLGGLVPVFAPLPSLSPPHHQLRHKSMNERKFEVAEDMFWKDGKPFQIIGGDVHYFRVLPEGIADLVSFVKLCQKLDLLVMLRAGPYICAEWDLGGFPAWLLAIKPALKLRSSDPAYLRIGICPYSFVERWWGVLLPKIAPLLYDNGGPIIMVQYENPNSNVQLRMNLGHMEMTRSYLHHLVTLARAHLGEEIVLYTTDGGRKENLQKGTISGDSVFSGKVDSNLLTSLLVMSLGLYLSYKRSSMPQENHHRFLRKCLVIIISDQLVHCYNACNFREFYTGWLTHWGEKIAATSADSTASYLEKILSKNGSAVLYVQ